MKSLKEHLKMRNSRFNTGSYPMSKWWGIEEVRELKYAAVLLACLLDVCLYFFFGWSFWNALILSAAFEIVTCGIISLISTLSERKYRLWQEARGGLVYTLNRLALNKTRKSHARKDRFEN